VSIANPLEVTASGGIGYPLAGIGVKPVQSGVEIVPSETLIAGNRQTAGAISLTKKDFWTSMALWVRH
jgi:hypothetical protein